MTNILTNILLINTSNDHLLVNENPLDKLIDNLSINEEPLNELVDKLSINENKEYELLINSYKKLQYYLEKPIIQKVNNDFYYFIHQIYEQNNKYLELVSFDKSFYEQNNTYTTNDIDNICVVFNKLQESNETYENLSKNKKLWNIYNIYKALHITNNAYTIIINNILN